MQQRFSMLVLYDNAIAFNRFDDDDATKSSIRDGTRVHVRVRDECERNECGGQFEWDEREFTKH